jgi:tripartite-type tricarboxylate transporter receptor subunit TctC
MKRPRVVPWALLLFEDIRTVGVHVPYRGQPQALTDLIGGQVQVMFDNLTESVGYIRAGSLRALAMTAATRWEGLPDLPTVNEFVPGFETGGWVGIGAPTGTPPELRRRN